MLTSITRWVLAHRRIVAAFWILVTLVGIATVGSSTSSFSKTFSVPGREGFETNAAIQRIYHDGGNNAPLVPVVTLPAGVSVNSPRVRQGLEQIETKLRAGAARNADGVVCIDRQPRVRLRRRAHDVRPRLRTAR